MALALLVEMLVDYRSFYSEVFLIIAVLRGIIWERKSDSNAKIAVL